MAKLLYIESSPRKERSHSIAVSQAFLDAYRAAHPNDTVETWDLWAETLPEFDGATINAKYSILHGADFSDAEGLAWGQITLIANRFKAADKIVISSPMWNFGVNYKLKHLIDVIAQPGLTFGFDPAKGYFGLVLGKPLLLILSRGGVYTPGTDSAAIDFQRSYLEFQMKFFGFENIHTVTLDGTLYGPDAAAKARAEAIDAVTKLAPTF